VVNGGIKGNGFLWYPFLVYWEYADKEQKGWKKTGRFMLINKT